MRHYKSKLGTALTAVFILTGCGGGSSSSPNVPEPVTVIDPAPTPPISSSPANAEAPRPQNILEAVSQAPTLEADRPEASGTAITLSGVAAKGLMSGARIIVFDPLMPPEDIAEEDDLLLGEGITDARGGFSVSVQTTEDTSDYLAIGALFEDATMICDAPSGCIGGAAFGDPASFGASDQALWAIFPKPAPGEATTANINVFTHLQLYRMLGIAIEAQEAPPAGEESEPITLNVDDFEPAHNFVVNAFKLESELFHTLPYVDATQPIESSNQNAVNMGMLAAGYLEAGTQAEIEKEGDAADPGEVLTNALIGFLFSDYLMVINESDTNNNKRSVSLEDIFDGALKAAELNPAPNNAQSTAIDWLQARSEEIDALPEGWRLNIDGTHPDVPEEDASSETPDPADPDPVDPDPVEPTTTDICHPALSPNASNEIVLLSGYEGTAVSSVAVSDLDRETEVTRVRIESGETPLYIIASTYTDMVWSIEGRTDRVAGFIAVKSRNPGTAGAGVVGLPMEKVDFIDHGCMEYFTSPTALTAMRAQTKYERIFDREINHTLSDYTLSSIAIPSGDMIDRDTRAEIERQAIAAGQSDITADNGIKFSIESQTPFADQTYLFRFTEEGLATVPAINVVSPGTVQTYDVFPHHAGLVQLLSSGHIEYRRADNTYFILKTFPRFPAGLTGAQSVKFILGTGVALPGGDPGHSSVLSEETGECLKGRC
jgi:hypothetical protein